MPKKLKLRLEGYTQAAERIAEGMPYCCNQIDRLFQCNYDHTPETVFFHNLFEVGPGYASSTFGNKLRNELKIRDDWVYQHADRRMIGLRLMALALAHTLAVEQNNGRKVL